MRAVTKSGAGKSSTATFTWVADPGTNSPPPAQVSVTQTCNFNWSLSDYDHGVSGSYTTGLGQSGPMAVGTSSTGGGSQTTTVSTGGQTDFQMSLSPTAGISGYVHGSCSYDLFGYRFTVAAAFANISLDVPSPDGHPELGDGRNQFVYDNIVPGRAEGEVERLYAHGATSLCMTTSSLVSLPMTKAICS